MLFFGLLVLSATASARLCPIEPTIPPWFRLGASTSSYQVEGAWNVSDKSASIWDTFTHNNPGAIADNSTGDVACDSYNLWERDIEMAAEMGLDFYRYRRVSISNHMVWYEPKTKADKALTELVIQYIIGRYGHPIYSKKGGWPSALEEYMEEYAAKLGHPRSQLPVFTEYEKALVRGTFDFIALNYYTTKLIRPGLEGEEVGNLFITGVPVLNAVMESPPTATYGYAADVAIYPKGLRRLLRWLKATYGNHEMVITENGFSSSGSEFNDQERINYIRNHLEQILLAMKLDFVKVRGYTHWALMDNFEWIDGYISKYGLYEVNFTDPLRTRTPRASAHYYSDIIKNRKLDICG